MHLQTNCRSNWQGKLTMGPSLYDLFLVMLHGIPTISQPLIYWAISLHLQTNCWSDLDEIRWAKSLRVSRSLINLWLCSVELFLFPGFCLAKQFLHISRQMLIGFNSNLMSKLIRGLPRPDFRPFAGFWMVEHFCLFAHTSLIGLNLNWAQDRSLLYEEKHPTSGPLQGFTWQIPPDGWSRICLFRVSEVWLL